MVKYTHMTRNFTETYGLDISPEELDLIDKARRYECRINGHHMRECVVYEPATGDGTPRDVAARLLACTHCNHQFEI